ncbi:hypothetical protein AVANS_0322 [Campylobacter sp. RM5004]|uniref:hypothetical protein n=1 Tax=Campylobacter sp. RM5004 TaxID=1660078 RepID=UPI001EFA31FF|nr:hypothetical protein [Campylobacter sp. RM5004]ULO00963.1 hypothetical protein AVANS_0322 [Campylobacter sp. RM5004]
MKKAVLAILALGFICNASAYSWSMSFPWAGSWRWPYISTEKANVYKNQRPIDCGYSYKYRKYMCGDY